MAGPYLTVVEVELFARQTRKLWTEAEKETFVTHIAANPMTGDLIPETGGVRKIRWSRSNLGKRGGMRVIYYYCDFSRTLYLLMAYAKTSRAT
jgi:hypothetical protein